ncbi:MAG: hypothetical protein ACYC36_03680 [Bellilinea sp.]
MTAQALIDNEGTRTVQVSDRDGMVIMHFEKPVRWCALDAQTAVSFAEAVARASYAATFGDTPTTQAKSQITDQLAARMRGRVELMLRSMMADGVDAKIQAQRIVDIVLTEVA